MNSLHVRIYVATGLLLPTRFLFIIAKQYLLFGDIYKIDILYCVNETKSSICLSNIIVILLSGSGFSLVKIIFCCSTPVTSLDEYSEFSIPENIAHENLFK